MIATHYIALEAESEEIDRRVAAASAHAAVVCTRDHEAIKRDDAAWSALAQRGRQVIDYGDGDVEIFEVANCTCHSTLYRLVKP